MGLRTAPPAPPARTFSNAPKHWPAVSFAGCASASDQYQALAGTLYSLTSSGAMVEFARRYAYDDGILEVPVVVQADDATTAVFFYPSAADNAAGRYAGARQILKQREGIQAVFYCAEPIAVAPPARVLVPLDTPMFTTWPAPIAEARYALWWPSAEDPTFALSEDVLLLDRWFAAIDGYGHALFSALGSELGFIPRQDGRAQLMLVPEAPYLHPTRGPEGSALLLHGSQDQGVFFTFDRATVSPARRRTLLRLLADFAERCRPVVERQVPSAPRDRALLTWHEIREQTLAQETAGATVPALYEIVISGGQVRPPTPPVSDAEAAARETLPSNDALQFAARLLQATASDIQQRTAARSSGDAPGTANVSPAIVAVVNGVVHRRQLYLESADLALAELAHACEEWPAATLIVGIVDSALRNDDGRVDVLRALVQEGGKAGDLLWRYTTDAQGVLVLDGHPSVSATAAFAGPPEPPPLGGAAVFDDACAAPVHEAVVYLTQIGSQTSGSTPALSAHTPFLMPFAIIGRGPQPGSRNAFAMMGAMDALQECRRMLAQDAAAESIVFGFDDLREVDGMPDRRLRCYVQRRGMPRAAIVDQRFDLPFAGRPLTLKGGRTFVRWTAPLFP
jgi:hypothetical protein